MRTLAARATVALLILGTCSLLVLEIVTNFTVGVLTDERLKFGGETLAAASGYYANSPRLLARLAVLSEEERDPDRAEKSALRAVKLSPHNYSYRLLVASIKASRGDLAEAEECLRAALALAPNKTEVHWQLANVLLRQGKLQQAVEEFRAASVLNPDLLPVSLNLVWRSSNGSTEAVNGVACGKPAARLALAQFLLKQGDVEYAAGVFGQLETAAQLVSREAGEFLNALIATGHLKLARDLWNAATGHDGKDSPLISNGSFESEIRRDFRQFDWMTYNNDYADIRIGRSAARTGTCSLRIDFAGRDTTRLDGEITQRLVVSPGERYKLDFYAKADKLTSPEGPRVVVTTAASSDWIGVSKPVTAGEAGWQHLGLEFNAPAAANGQALEVLVTIKRRPKFSYDGPTRGTVYFDDFVLAEAPASKEQIASRAQR
ncbi:MAG: tetratricopeptide repeat protein [Acidobacteriota bacterium]